MKINRRTKFLCHIVFLFVVLMAISIFIGMRPFAQVIIWGLFAYIIAKEWIDHLREERDIERLRALSKKLDKIIQDIKGTV